MEELLSALNIDRQTQLDMVEKVLEMDEKDDLNKSFTEVQAEACRDMATWLAERRERIELFVALVINSVVF